jgi:hypothetical protein
VAAHAPWRAEHDIPHGCLVRPGDAAFGGLGRGRALPRDDGAFPRCSPRRSLFALMFASPNNPTRCDPTLEEPS